MNSNGANVLIGSLLLIAMVWWLFFRTTVGSVIKKQNLFPPLLNTPVQDVSRIGSGNLFRQDIHLDPGWKYENVETIRQKTTDTPGVINPSGDPYYFRLTYSYSKLMADVTDLVVGQSYQLSGYIYYYQCNDCVGGIVVAIDGHTVFSAQYPQTNFMQFVKLGPFTWKAITKTHTILFANSSGTLDKKGDAYGIGTPMLLTGLLFE